MSENNPRFKEGDIILVKGREKVLVERDPEWSRRFKQWMYNVIHADGSSKCWNERWLSPSRKPGSKQRRFDPRMNTTEARRRRYAKALSDWEQGA